MGLFNKLSGDESALLDRFKTIADEISNLDLDMKAAPSKETAERMIRSGNSLSDAINDGKYLITNLSVHHKKSFALIQELGSQVRTLRDQAIQYLDYEDAVESKSNSEKQIDWERKVIERLCSIKPIKFYFGDMGFRGNAISMIPNGSDWEYLKQEFSVSQKLPISAWKEVRARSEQSCMDLNVPWRHGDGSQPIEI